MSEIVSLNRTLDQELLTLMRGASLECLVCGEFVLHAGAGIHCPQCETRFGGAAESGLQLTVQAG
jgi:hypothetical protein